MTRVKHLERAWPLSAPEMHQATASYPDEVRDAARWLYNYGTQNDASLNDMAKSIGYSSSSLSRFYRGIYEGNLESISAAVMACKELIEKRADVKTIAFVETETAKQIFKVCEAASKYQWMTTIWGESHIGKTWALQEYARRNNHGRTRYIRIPAMPNAGKVLLTIAQASGVGTKQSGTRLASSIIKATDNGNLLIFDELHQLFETSGQKTAIGIIEFIREIYDRCGCGVVLCGTNVLRDELCQHNRSHLFKQLLKRAILQRQLPDYATREDLSMIASHFGLNDLKNEPYDAMKKINIKWGLKAITSTLQAACTIAKKSNRPVTWDDFLKATNILGNLN